MRTRLESRHFLLSPGPIEEWSADASNSNPSTASSSSSSPAKPTREDSTDQGFSEDVLSPSNNNATPVGGHSSGCPKSAEPSLTSKLRSIRRRSSATNHLADVRVSVEKMPKLEGGTKAATAASKPAMVTSAPAKPGVGKRRHSDQGQQQRQQDLKAEVDQKKMKLEVRSRSLSKSEASCVNKLQILYCLHESKTNIARS